jgi:hypothetical protein
MWKEQWEMECQLARGACDPVAPHVFLATFLVFVGDVCNVFVEVDPLLECGEESGNWHPTLTCSLRYAACTNKQTESPSSIISRGATWCTQEMRTVDERTNIKIQGAQTELPLFDFDGLCANVCTRVLPSLPCATRLISGRPTATRTAGDFMTNVCRGGAEGRVLEGPVLVRSQLHECLRACVQASQARDIGIGGGTC